MFELFEMKCKNIYIFETKNYFGTIEGEFKAQYNNHKMSFANCIEGKATELSNTFGTQPCTSKRSICRNS